MISPEVDSNAQMVFGNQNWASRVQGVGPDYFKIRNWPIVLGGAFSQRDVDTGANVAVIGATVANNLFGGDDPIGKVIRVKRLPVTVVGQLQTKGQSTFGQDQDDVVMMPYSTVQKKVAGIYWLQSVQAACDSKDDLGLATTQITSLLRQRHHLRANEHERFFHSQPG